MLPRPPLTRRLLRSLSNSGLLLPIGLIVIWQATDRATPRFLPNPADLIHVAIGLSAHGLLAQDLLASIVRMLCGFAVGATGGAIIGIALAASTRLHTLLGPAVSAWRQLPIFSLVPLLTLWFGLDEKAKIILIALATSIPVMLNAYEGVRAVPKKYTEVADMLHLNPLSRLLLLQAPAAMPFLLTGLRQGMAFAWMATVASELFLAAAPGLGAVIMAGQERMRPDMIIIGISLIGGVGILMNAALTAAIRWVLPAWRATDQQDNLS